MKDFKNIVAVASFALLAACGSEDTSKFVGTWVDTTPKKEAKSFGFITRESEDITIKQGTPGEVALTATVMGHEKTYVYKVKGPDILSGSRVIYTLDGNELHKVGTELKLVRK